MRIKRGVTRQRRHRKVLQGASGFRAARGKLFRTASIALDKAGSYAYRDRRQRKRQFHRLWITRINAAARQNGISYSKLIHGLKLAGVEVNRKMLADLAIREPEAFAQIVTHAKGRLEEEPVAA